MTAKFGRAYRLVINPADGKPPILITLPFTVEFWLERNTLSDLNHLSIDIYNLSESNRARIFQDRFDLGGVAQQDGSEKPKKIIFEAGYATLYRIYEGEIWEASSKRDGTNIITRIEARTGQFDVSRTQTFQTLQSGQTVGDVMKYLAGQFPNLKLGGIGEYNEKLNRPVALNGNTFDLLKTYSNGNVYIDNGRIYILKNSDVLDTIIPVISDSTGLLETPAREDTVLRISTLLETSINYLGWLYLESSIQKLYNGQYQVIGIQHQGTISNAVCGNARSNFTLLAKNRFKNVTMVKPL